jgi:hypothetical protein
MLILISSLKLSTVSYAAGPESRGHSRTAWLYNNVKGGGLTGMTLIEPQITYWSSSKVYRKNKKKEMKQTSSLRERESYGV